MPMWRCPEHGLRFPKPCCNKAQKQKQDPSIEDGFGNVWSKRCPECKRLSMEIVRPGKVQCGFCG